MFNTLFKTKLFKSRRRQLVPLLLIAFVVSCTQAEFTSNKTGALPDKVVNPVILISLDGFRYDYIEKFRPPNLLKLIETGVRAERMLPVYPSKTFPNHISLITGMYPSKHGIVHNSFYDRELDDVYKMGKAFQQPKWMQGTPLWIHAERNGMTTASFFWPESDSTLEGISASYSFKYDQQKPRQDRIDQMINWLKLPSSQRPNFITGYFSLIDVIGHQYGPSSPKVKDAVLEIDRYIGDLKNRIDNELDFDVNLVVVADHGMVDIDYNQRVIWSKLGAFENYKVINGTTQLMLYANSDVNQKDISKLVTQLNAQRKNRFKAYRKQDLPKHMQYFNNNRIADIIVEAIPPIIFGSHKKPHDPEFGMHGYDPDVIPEMAAIFIANGPNFKQGVVIPKFRNVHVFPALVDILKLPMPTNIDGKLEVLKPIILE